MKRRYAESKPCYVFRTIVENQNPTIGGVILYNSEPELITIVEGPTPEFRPSPNLLFHSVYEGPEDADIAICELRTLNGESIVERCRNAWKEGRPVRLDFPDYMRMRQQLDVVGMRLQELEEGPMLMLWVRQQLDQEEYEEEGFDEDDEDFIF